MLLHPWHGRLARDRPCGRTLRCANTGETPVPPAIHDANPVKSTRPQRPSDPLPMRRQLLPMRRERLPMRRELLPMRRQLLPMRRQLLPMRRRLLPMRRQLLPMRRRLLPMRRQRLPMRREQSPTRREVLPIRRERCPCHLRRSVGCLDKSAAVQGRPAFARADRHGAFSRWNGAWPGCPRRRHRWPPPRPVCRTSTPTASGRSPS